MPSYFSYLDALFALGGVSALLGLSGAVYALARVQQPAKRYTVARLDGASVQAPAAVQAVAETTQVVA